MSPAARAAVFAAVRRDAAAAPDRRRLFPLAPRLAVAGALTVLLVATLTLLRVQPGSEPAGSFVTASKDGEKVVFRIANGHRPHTVYRSTQAERFDPASGVRVTGGLFTDPATGGPDLVFYRID